MAREERQRERKRRRRKLREDGEQEFAEGATGDEAAESATAAHPATAASDTELEWDPDESSSVPESPETPPPTLAAGRPAAVAQILAAPSRDSDATDAEPASASDPFFAQQPREPDDHVAGTQTLPPNDPFAHPPEFPAPAYEHERRWTNEPVLVALLLVTLIVLALDTYFTLRLKGVSDRLAASAAKPAATTTVGGERPWVGVDTIRTAQFANGGQPVTTVHIVNSGREPAYDLRSNTVGSLRSSTTPAPEIPKQKGPLATTGLLLPNTGGNLTFFANTRALTAQEAANVRSGQFVLWLAGRLDYKDSKGHQHLTTFRYRYNPQLNSFVAAPDGNTAS